jgi:hypothetical protein
VAEVKTDTFLVDPKGGHDQAEKPSLRDHPGDQGIAVWRFSLPGACNRLALHVDANRPPVRPRRAVTVIVKLECSELDGSRTWQRLLAAVLAPPTFW